MLESAVAVLCNCCLLTSVQWFQNQDMDQEASEDTCSVTVFLAPSACLCAFGCCDSSARNRSGLLAMWSSGMWSSGTVQGANAAPCIERGNSSPAISCKDGSSTVLPGDVIFPNVTLSPAFPSSSPCCGTDGVQMAMHSHSGTSNRLTSHGQACKGSTSGNLLLCGRSCGLFLSLSTLSATLCSLMVCQNHSCLAFGALLRMCRSFSGLRFS